MYKSIRKLTLALLTILVANTAFSTDFKLHRYVSSNVYHTNSYWLESESGIALIDSQMLVSDAKLLALLVKSTGKSVKGAILTHPHADHYGGLNTLKSELGNFPVYTTQKTAAGIETFHNNAVGWAGEAYGDDFDLVLTKVDQIVKSGTEIDIAGITLKIDDIGAGESENSVLIYQKDKNILFTGDATMHHGHFYTGESHSDDAIEQHQYIQTNYGDVSGLYPGHGDPASPSVILEPEIEYIKYVQSIAKEAIANGDISEKGEWGFKDEEVKPLVAKVLAKYPDRNDYAIGAEMYITWNINGVLSEFKK